MIGISATPGFVLYVVGVGLFFGWLGICVGVGRSVGRAIGTRLGLGA